MSNIDSTSNAGMRVDRGREPVARRIADAAVEHMNAEGRYEPPEAFFPESVGYRAELAATMAMAGELLDRRPWIDAAVRMFDRLLDERVDGMWPIGWWCRFPVYRPLPLEWKRQNSSPDARYTALALYSLSLLYRATGDKRYVEPARTALTAMMERWDPLAETKRLHLTAEACALAVMGWENELGLYTDTKTRIVEWAASTFPETAPADFPFACLIRMMLLVAAGGTRYLKDSIKPAIDALLAVPDWRYAEHPADFRHIADTDDHINIRGNGAVASIMRIYDLVAGDTVYTETQEYAHVSAWMDEMIGSNGLSYGCMRHQDRIRYGLGSPAQYMQLWWMLGGFML